MLALVALLACAVLAQPPPPPRPSISEDFYADVDTELHAQDQDIYGRGRWAVDTTQNEGVEDYEFDDQRHGRLYVFNLQRYDLGYVYQIDSNDRNKCQSQKVTGSMPSNWGWIANANYDGPHDFHGQNLNVWNTSIAGIELAVGVTSEDPNTPVFFFRGQTSSALLINFLRFNASTNFNHSWFDVPQQCQSSVTLKATPTRPNISEIFEAEVQVQFQRTGGEYIQGEGRMAANQPAGLFVEDYDLESPRDHNYIKLFSLFRYDLGKAYFINSHNWTDCVEQPTNGTLAPFWGWIASASFVEQRTEHDFTEDIWSFVVSGINVTVSVSNSDVNTPLWLSRSTTGTNEFWDFRVFDPTTPNQQDFTVPPECQK